jgi:GT2 family glycosyltransferase
MSHPLVSVIIPVYNCERFVAEALRSVLAQDYPNLEVIVVDDGSTDATVSIVESLGPRIRLLRQRNLGPAAARNRAVQASAGEYLAFLDGDDAWLPGKVSAQVEFAQAHPEYPIVFTENGYWRPDSSGNYRAATEYAGDQPGSLRPGLIPPGDVRHAVARGKTGETSCSGWLYPTMLLFSPIHIITTLIPRTLYDAIGGFDESLRSGSDYDFWLKATYRYRAHSIPGCYALYRLHGGGVTSVPRPVNYPYLILTRALAQLGRCAPDGRCVDERRLQERLSEMCFRYGRIHLLKGDAKLARQAFLRALRHHSRRRSRVLIYALLASVREAFGARLSGALYRSAKALVKGNTSA